MRRKKVKPLPHPHFGADTSHFIFPSIRKGCNMESEPLQFVPAPTMDKMFERITIGMTIGLVVGGIAGYLLYRDEMWITGNVLHNVNVETALNSKPV